MFILKSFFSVKRQKKNQKSVEGNTGMKRKKGIWKKDRAQMSVEWYYNTDLFSQIFLLMAEEAHANLTETPQLSS